MASANPQHQPRSPSNTIVIMRRLLTWVHISLYQLTGGRIGHRLGNVPTLLLTATGRKSGKPRTIPLAYITDGETYVIVASNWGAATHPHWFLNLQTHPIADIQIGNKKIRVRAERASSAEKERLWPLAVKVYAGYAGYQRRITRDIPLVILHPLKG